MEEGGEPVAATVVLADQLGRGGKHAQRPPAERVGEPDQRRQRHEDHPAQLELAQPPQPQPQRKGVEGQRHRQREVHEAEVEGVAVDQRQREQRRRRDAAVHLARDPEEADRGQHGDRHHDQLDREFQAQDRLEGHDQEIDPQVAHQAPVEVVPVGEPGRRAGADGLLHAVAAHVAGQVDERGDLRPHQRHGGQHRHREHEPSRLPPVWRCPIPLHGPAFTRHLPGGKRMRVGVPPGARRGGGRSCDMGRKGAGPARLHRPHEAFSGRGGRAGAGAARSA